MDDTASPPTGGQAAADGSLEAARLEPVPATLAERLRALEQRARATSERYVKGGRIYLALVLSDEGDRISAGGASTAEALTALEAKVARVLPTEEA